MKLNFGVFVEIGGLIHIILMSWKDYLMAHLSVLFVERRLQKDVQDVILSGTVVGR